MVPKLCLLFLLVFLAFWATRTHFSKLHVVKAATPTELRIAEAGWWPTKGTAAPEEYAGTGSCTSCHSEIFQRQQKTPMAEALSPANGTSIPGLSQKPAQFRVNGLDYEVVANDKLNYSVRDGKNSLSVPVNWIFGDGQFGRTFVYEYKGNYYESRLSYYGEGHGLDFTTGNPGQTPGRLDAALGRRMSLDELPLCFGCHSTKASTNGQFDPSHLTPGVSCEACHGPGTAHVAEMSMGSGRSATLISNVSKLSPTDSVDYCGACHRTSADVTLMGVTGVLTLRFPAYRLERSRCWGKNGDGRLTCIACHDPHEDLVREATAYDKKCLGCHQAAGSSKLRASNHLPSCPTGRPGCVSCHMPKHEIPEMHATFTDHRIGIYAPNAAFSE